MLEKNLKKIKKLKGKWFYDELNIIEYDTLMELENMKAEDDYWDCKTKEDERRNDF